MRGMFRSRWLQVGLVLCLLGGAAGIWALLHPAAFWLQPWRPERSVVSSRYIFGPYPIEPDFIALKEQGVTTIISLLDPALPYEAVLLGQEQELARKYGMRVLNFPMASILGQSFGKDYLANSRAAAQAALGSQGTVYLHCYLGLHRAANVRKFLEEHAETTGYEGTLKSGRSADVLALDYANIAFLEGNMEEALRHLATIASPTPDSTLLGAWANYRLGRIEAARGGFEQVAAARPDLTDALAGLGYCALRSDDLAEAEKQFGLVLAAHPDDPSALQGLGHVRHRQGRTSEARALFARVLAKHPQNSEVRELLEKLTANQRHVVLIVVDGLRPDALTAAPAPQMLELAAAGATTRTARAVEIPATVPSVVTMITGVSPQRHGMHGDADRIESLTLATLFTRVHDSGGRNAVYFGKTKLGALAAASTAEVRHGPAAADGTDWAAGSSTTLVEQFAREFRERPFEFTLIHLREADFAGHQKGWMSADYLAAVRQVDGAVGAIRKAIAESSAADRTTVILTSDHGGDGTRHATASDVAWTIPWMCAGARVRRGAIGGSVTLLDVAPTVLALLNLPPLPQAEGKPVAECVAG